MSYVSLTRLLPAHGSGPTLLEPVYRKRCVWEPGDLILNDTMIAKPFATPVHRRAWVFSSQERRPAYGFSLGLLV
jgi:hypothetical protein